MQQPSPALSSPSTGFFGTKASPLFTQSVDQPDPSSLLCSSDFPRPLSLDSSASSLQHGQQAPPKHLAQAMEGLGQAIRLIAEVRLGADLLLEALERAAKQRENEVTNAKKASEWVVQAGDVIGAALEALRITGRKLDASGVLNGAQQRFEEKQPWGLQVPLICSDGAIVAYSWKRQIAGQAAASAVDRTRLALKAFTEQKRRFFPRFGDSNDEGEALAASSEKRLRLSNGADAPMPGPGKLDESSQDVSLSNLLRSWQTETLGTVIASFTRLEWIKQKSMNCQMGSRQRGSAGSGVVASAFALKVSSASSPSENVAILEITVPAVFKAVVSLFPSGSLCPDGVSLFSVEEARPNTYVGGASSHAVFRTISEYATNALHKFLLVARPTALNLLLHWLYTYRSLFSKPCSQCKRILALDRTSDLLLPPVVRPPHQVLKMTPSVLNVKVEDLNDDKISAYHVACMPKEENGTY